MRSSIISRCKNSMSSKQIATNTAITYLRFILSAGLALFSSRWVLNALGQTDYGIFSLVGTLIVFVTALNNLMASSAARYFAYTIGQKDKSELKKWFNASIGIHIILAMLLTATGWPIGEYVILKVLIIPADRISIATWIFRISLISAFFSMLSVPFVAMFTAKQKMTELAVWGIIQAICCFILAWFLMHETQNRLWFYATGMVAISVITNVTQIIRALHSFDECHITISEWFNRNKCRQLFSFAGWNLFGWSGVILRDQGSAVLINLFFGPSANAAYAIATQVANQTNQFSAVMISAFSPAITATEGSGERDRMLAMSQHANTYGTILALLLTIPLMVEMDVILTLWLKAPPPNTAIFCQLILATFIIDRLTSGYMLAVNARGKIAAYQATVGTSLLLTLPIAWAFLKIGLQPFSVGIAFIITMILTSFGRILWVRNLFSISCYNWLKIVFRPCALIAFTSVVAAILLRTYFEPSIYRLFLIFSTTTLCSLTIAWFYVVDQNTRRSAISMVMRHV